MSTPHSSDHVRSRRSQPLAEGRLARLAAFARGCCWEPRLGWLNAAPLVLLVVVLISGVGFAWWSVQRSDALMREDLKRQVMLVAQAVDPNYVKGLSGSRSDMYGAEYARVRQQITLAKQANAHWEWIYLMGRRSDGRVFFFLDSEPDDDPDATLPGDVYDEATPLLHHAFDTSASIVEGPVTDIWGTWVSGLAPVLDPVTGELLALAGIDVEAGQWPRSAWRAGIFPLAVMLFLAGVVATGRILLYVRSTSDLYFSGQAGYGWMRFIEAGLAAVVGTILTLVIAWEMHTGERRNHFNSFAMQANAKATRIQGVLRRIADTELEGLAAFLETTGALTSDLYVRYTHHLAGNNAVLAWQWLPFVPEARKSGFENEMRRTTGHYGIWERDAQNRTVPADARSAYYPVAYSVPLLGSESFLGHDAGSGPHGRTALETALLTGLTTGTDAFDLYQGEGATKGMLVLRAVSGRFMPESVSRPRGFLDPPGFAAAVLHLETLLQDTVSGLYAAGGMPLTNIELYQLHPDTSPEFLGSTRGIGPKSASRFPFQVSRPLFAFGKTYAAMVTPTAAFDALHPVTTGRSVTLSGLFMTGAVTLVVGFLAGRRESLKRLVVARTASLRENERRLRTALAQAEEATRVKSEFLANMSHEIRTPLNAIIGMTELVQEESLDDGQKDAFQTIAREAGALLDIINDILDYSRIEAGQLHLEQVEFGLRDVLEQVADVFAYQAEMKGVGYLTYLAPETPQRLLGDPLRLRQILLNFSSNALKFTHKGEISISVTVFDLPMSKKHVTASVLTAPSITVERASATRPTGLLFQVRDTGIGIPEQKQLTVFDSFTQADGSTTRKYGGTGLGLAICKRFVELMGGEIGVQSTEGSGSTFWFKVVLDALVEDDRVVKDTRNNRHDSGTDGTWITFRAEHRPIVQAAAQAREQRKHIRILLVEDYPANQQVALRHLYQAGYSADLAENGHQAVEAFQHNAYDLILMDIQMPVMDGYEATREIRKLEHSAGMLENWNAGIEKPEKNASTSAPSGRPVAHPLSVSPTSQHSSIPAFQHSSIPAFQSPHHRHDRPCPQRVSRNLSGGGDG